MFAKPQTEHVWLEQFIGEWEFEHRCTMHDGTVSSTPGKMVCRSLGAMWLICESHGEAEEGGPWSSIMTLGFDPAKNHYVGTFIGSMMANLWAYQGVMDPSGKRLPLAAQGPKFDGSGVGEYRDTIEIVDKDNWLFTSEILSDAGQWVKFMDGKHVRLKE